MPSSPPVLGPGEIHVWRCRNNAPLSPSVAACLSPWERQRADRFRKEPLRQSYCSSRAILRQVLARELCADPAELVIEADAAGKPFLPHHPGLHFNLSHSGPWTVLALCRHGPVGIDVEMTTPAPPLEAAETVFSAAEQVLLRDAAAPCRAALFYMLWVRKEALAKAVGHGLLADLRAYDVALGMEADISTPRLPPGLAGEGGWQLWRLPQIPGAATALAAPDGTLTVRCWAWGLV